MKTSFKILHFITNSSHHPLLYAMTDNTDKRKFDMSVASLNPAGDLQIRYNETGIKTFALDTVKRTQFPQAVLKLSQWLKNNRIDIIQTHLLEASWIGLAAAKLARTPVKILTGHHSAEMPFYKRKPAFWGDVLSSRWLADYIIAPSEQMKEIFIKEEGVPAEKIVIIHHGLDFSNWKSSEAGRERIRNEFNINGKIVFGAIGRIFWSKAYPTLFKAFAPVAEKHPNLTLMVIGAGDLTELRQLARELGIEKQIIFAGWRNDITDLFSAMDVFVHPSLVESFGLVIIEAMAMGKPIICTDVGIAREIIKDNINGFLVPTGSEEKLSTAMEKIIHLRSQWSEIGIVNKKISQKFTAAKMAAEYQKCYFNWLSEQKIRN